MRAVFQHHINASGTGLKKHWNIWHGSTPVAKQERIKTFERDLQAGKWKFYQVCVSQGWMGPQEYYNLDMFG
jgi:hypothetical protein